MKEQEKHFSSYLTNGAVWHHQKIDLLEYILENKLYQRYVFNDIVRILTNIQEVLITTNQNNSVD